MTKPHAVNPFTTLMQSPLSRREQLKVLGALGAGLLLPTASATAACTLAPSMTEGPYWVDEKLNRQDLTTGSTRPGVVNGLPFSLLIKLQDDNGLQCSAAPAANVMVDIWHCDALGAYSDVAGGGGQSSTLGENFLRGHQISNSVGEVLFKTIYPGWYSGRAVHIHFRARVFDASGNVTYNFVSQLFFDDALTDQLYASAPYNSRGTRNTRNSTDNIYRSSSNSPLVTVSTAATGGLQGSVNFGLAALPTTQALQRFAASLRLTGSAAMPDLITDMTISTEHVGSLGALYVAAQVGADWYFFNGSQWLKVGDPLRDGFPAAYQGSLKSSHSLTLLSGVPVASLGRLTLLAGYGLDALDMLQNNRYQLLGDLNG